MTIQLFVDTNILLSFYHYTKDELDEIKKLVILIKQKEIKLFITQQVVDEYRRNRETKLNDALKQINERFKFGDYPSFCKEFSAYTELDNAIKKAQSIHKELLGYVHDKIANNNFQADFILSQLFQVAEILPISEEIFKRAERRVLLGNPPGKNSSYGDAINWEIILENSLLLYDLHLVANDKDYFSIMNKEKINPFLKLEFEENMIGDISCYRSLTSFFKANFPALSLTAEQEKDEIVLNLVKSPNFATTKKELKRLKKYSIYTIQQVEDVLNACFANTQINWILSDDDVKKQVCELYDSYRDNLSVEFKNYFNDKWHQHFPEDLIVLGEDKDLPF